MSNKNRKNPKTLGEQKTLPLQAPDAKVPNTGAARQNDDNVKRAKNWGDKHAT